MDYTDPELVHSRSFEMNWQQTYRGQLFMLCGGNVRSYMIIPSLWGCMFWFLPAGRFLWNFEAFSIYTDWVLESLKHSCFGTAFSFLTIHSVWGVFKWCPNPQFGWIQTEVIDFWQETIVLNDNCLSNFPEHHVRWLQKFAMRFSFRWLSLGWPKSNASLSCWRTRQHSLIIKYCQYQMMSFWDFRITLVCATRWTSRLGCHFTHANYLDIKTSSQKLMTFVYRNHTKNRILVFWYCGNKYSK
jgi:hypothetical protein